MGMYDYATMMALARQWREAQAATEEENKMLKIENADMKAALEIMEVEIDG